MNVSVIISYYKLKKTMHEQTNVNKKRMNNEKIKDLISYCL